MHDLITNFDKIFEISKFCYQQRPEKDDGVYQVDAVFGTYNFILKDPAKFLPGAAIPDAKGM